MNVIVAADQNWAIGKDGDQLVYISADLQRFKSLTLGHPVILGRKTLATFPGGRPLKGRRNLILSRNQEFAPQNAEVFSSLEALLSVAPEDSFVLGGASVYQALLDRCDTAYVTKIGRSFPEADCWFPNLDARPEWRAVEEGPELEESGLPFQYVTYRKG